MTTTTREPTSVGPLLNAAPLDVQANLRLRGAALGPHWLPSHGRWPGLKEVRAAHLKRLQAVHDAVELIARPHRENEERARQYQHDLEKAMRNGKPKPEDPRVPKAELDQLVERHMPEVDAAFRVLEEFIGGTIEKIQEHANEWLGVVNQDRFQAEQRAREAQAIVDEAQAQVAASRTPA